MDCKYGEKLVSYHRQDSCCPEYLCGEFGHILCPILFESVYLCVHSNSCMLIVFLECDPDQCVLDIPVCREDQTLIATRAEGSCCLAHICSKSLRLMLKSC